ncbi:MAG: hypothetical protein C0445_10890 [Polaromonas sp.]|nr:hypothetical protein [Polaromonas sp.]
MSVMLWMPLASAFRRDLLVAGLALAVMCCHPRAQAAKPTFDEVFNQMSATMLLIDPDSGRIVDANPAAAAFYGHSQAQLRAMRIQAINTLSPEQVAQERQLAAQQGRSYFVFRHRLADGTSRTVRVRSSPFEFEGRTLLLSIISDITSNASDEAALWHYKTRLEATVDDQAQAMADSQRTQTWLLAVGLLMQASLIGYLWASRRRGQQWQAELQATRNHLQATLNAMPDLLFELDVDGRFVGVHTSRPEDLLLPPEQFIGQLMEAVLPPHISAIAREAMQEASAHGASSGHVYQLALASGVRHFELSVAVKPASRGQAGGFVVVARDITQKQQHQEELEHVAHFDALTGLPNRVLLSDRLNQAMAHSLRSGLNLAVVFLDLDGFKAVNDQHGHEVGDQLLVALSERLKQALREGDTLARLGVDEFVAVLVGLEDVGGCLPVLQRLLRAAADPVVLTSGRVQVSASLGVTLFPQDAADADQLMRHADQAMYQAKQAGKNQYHLFDVESDSAVKTQAEKLARIAQALNNDELVLHYQPQVNMRTGQLVGVEALVRWQHPDEGLLAPGHFLPVLEGKPLAADLDEWVLDQAFAQLSAWQAQGFEVPVSVNVCAASLQKPGFVRRLVQRQVAHPSLARELIKLEMLETSALEDMTGTAGVMRACSLIGVKFALDDFGTGYSSLTYLRRLPAEQLKIDQSFVRDMLEDPDDLGIVQGIMGLASAFKREVIAEGVETVAHGEHLLMLGCELAQGYGIARPMPPEQLPTWASRWVPPPSWHAPGADPVSEG